jgi:hypothetical protein
MRFFRNAIQHHLNPLHIYCRLRCAGFPGPTAQKISAFYERFFYRYTMTS